MFRVYLYTDTSKNIFEWWTGGRHLPSRSFTFLLPSWSGARAQNLPRFPSLLFSPIVFPSHSSGPLISISYLSSPTSLLPCPPLIFYLSAIREPTCSKGMPDMHRTTIFLYTIQPATSIYTTTVGMKDREATFRIFS